MKTVSEILMFLLICAAMFALGAATIGVELGQAKAAREICEKFGYVNGGRVIDGVLQCDTRAVLR